MDVQGDNIDSNFSKPPEFLASPFQPTRESCQKGPNRNHAKSVSSAFRRAPTPSQSRPSAPHFDLKNPRPQLELLQRSQTTHLHTNPFNAPHQFVRATPPHTHEHPHTSERRYDLSRSPDENTPIERIRSDNDPQGTPVAFARSHGLHGIQPLTVGTNENVGSDGSDIKLSLGGSPRSYPLAETSYLPHSSQTLADPAKAEHDPPSHNHSLSSRIAALKRGAAENTDPQSKQTRRFSPLTTSFSVPNADLLENNSVIARRSDGHPPVPRSRSKSVAGHRAESTSASDTGSTPAPSDLPVVLSQALVSVQNWSIENEAMVWLSVSPFMVPENDTSHDLSH